MPRPRRVPLARWLGLALAILLLAGVEVLVPSPAAALCPDGEMVLVKSIATICWDCFFPISLFGANIVDSTGGGSVVGDAPAVGPGEPFPWPNPWPPPFLCGCQCEELFGLCLPGIPLGYWEPRHLVEVVVDPYCFPSLGLNLVGTQFEGHGTQEYTREETDSLNTHSGQVHFIFFPVFKIFSIIVDVLCLNATALLGDLDVVYLTEVDPMWADDVLTGIMFPETLLFTNPVAIAACAADAVSNLSGVTIDPLFWCAGDWGSLYPPAGTVEGANGGALTSQALLWARVLAKLARSGMELYAAGNADLLCWDLPTFMLVKSQYKAQLIDPVANTAPACCTVLGQSDLVWGMMKMFPVEGEHHVWLLWRRQNCCML